MPGKCAKCLVDLSATDVIAKCVDCNTEYHPPCTRLGSAQNISKNKLKSWKCDSCHDEANSTASVRSNEEDKKSILDAIKSMKTEFITTMENKIGEVNTSIGSLSEDIKSLKTSFDSLDEKQKELSKRCDDLQQENRRLQDETWELKLQLQDVEQHSRSANLEIVGVPQTTGENVYDVLGKVASAIGITFNKSHVSIAHRLRLYSKKHTYSPIIVQFTSRAVREMWLTTMRAKKDLLASEIEATFPGTKVFINEHLTPNNKMLLGRARKLRRLGKLHFAGYSNGKVLIKPKEDSPAIRVQFLEDMDKYE